MAAGPGALGEPTLKISELAEGAGVPVATVRHYLREGLLPEGHKTSRNMAYYPPELIDRIKLIKQLQEERFMPLRVIGDLLASEDGDTAKVRSRIEAADRGLDAALARERERVPAAAVGERLEVPLEALERLAEVGVISTPADGLTPSDVRIVEAIARFRAGGYDETIGFTVYDANRFIEPLQALARREVELLSEKIVGRLPPDRAAALIEAGIDPLADLIAAMHSRLVAAELGRRLSPGAEGEPDT